MTERPSRAEQLDAALDSIISNPSSRTPAVADPALRPLVSLAGDVAAALPRPLVAPGFEARLGSRLADTAQPRDPLAWALRHPARVIVTGAVGSAAVGVGITAFAVWRGRRHPAAAHRLLHR
jgi:hypothetical protein